MQIVFAILVIMFVFGLSEPPLWLMNQGQGHKWMCAVYDRVPGDEHIVNGPPPNNSDPTFKPPHSHDDGRSDLAFLLVYVDVRQDS